MARSRVRGEDAWRRQGLPVAFVIKNRYAWEVKPSLHPPMEGCFGGAAVATPNRLARRASPACGPARTLADDLLTISQKKNPITRAGTAAGDAELPLGAQQT